MKKKKVQVSIPMIVFCIRLTRLEKEKIRLHAASEGLTMSEWVRSLIKRGSK